LSSVASIFALVALGRRLFSTTVGLIAGVLLVINGFALGLSRIVQYQPAMLLLSILAVLAAWEFAQSGHARWLALAAIFSAFGTIMHYEFALLAPLLVICMAVGWRRTGSKRSLVITAGCAGAVAACLVTAAYAPVLHNAFFATTQSYLSTRLGDATSWNLPFFFEMGTFYNSVYFFAGLLGLVMAGLVWGWRHAWRPTCLLVFARLVPAGGAAAGCPIVVNRAAHRRTLGGIGAGFTLARSIEQLSLSDVFSAEAGVPGQLRRDAQPILLGAVWQKCAGKATLWLPDSRRLEDTGRPRRVALSG
jgi:hypothetical protein